MGWNWLLMMRVFSRTPVLIQREAEARRRRAGSPWVVGRQKQSVDRPVRGLQPEGAAGRGQAGAAGF